MQFINWMSEVETNWTCSICFDFAEEIVQLVAFDNVASTLLLVWTGLKSRRHQQPAAEPDIKVDGAYYEDVR